MENSFSAFSASGDGLGEVAADDHAEQADTPGLVKQDAGAVGDGALDLLVLPTAAGEQNRRFAGIFRTYTGVEMAPLAAKASSRNLVLNFLSISM